jgi:energy-coupling factor transporter ATP-binding protein EcfA2
MAMPARPDLLVALAWDQSSRPSYAVANDLSRPESDAVGFAIPGYDRSSASLLDDIVVPAFADADQVLALWSPNDPLWIAFQVGLAVGLERPVRVVAFDGDAPASRGLPVGVATIDDEPSGTREVASQRFPDADPVAFESGTILLCPRETEDDRALLDNLKSRLGNRQYRRIGPNRERAPAVDDVVWVITEHGTRGREEHNLRPNLGNAFEAGRCYGATVRSGGRPALAIIRSVAVPPISALEHLTRVAADAAAAADLVGAPTDLPLRVTSVELRDLKCFRSIKANLSTDSPLGGAWTCIAGVNGAGKSTILQSIALGLLGRSSAPELGLARLARMVRRDDGSAKTTTSGCEIRLTLSAGNVVGEVVLPLGPTGIDERRLASTTDRALMEQLWERTRGMLVVGYGATRNMSDTLAGASTSMSPLAHRQLTLFDPLGQIVSAEALVAGGPRFEPMLRTTATLVTMLLDEPDAPFRCEVINGKLVFRRDDAELGALDLPDGFRSVLALLADIAAGWHELHPDADTVDPADITGVALVDELDLHLHARLQREIVPRLRRALPGMQWIVSTHSPFIVGSFDQTELVVLDRDAPGGIRELDRQVLAFTANDIYDWLLDARPVSLAGERAAGADDGASLLYQSPERNAEAAERLLARQDDMLAQLRNVKA